MCELLILQEAKKEASVINPITSGYMELDVWVPNLGLIFEFQVISVQKNKLDWNKKLYS